MNTCAESEYNRIISKKGEQEYVKYLYPSAQPYAKHRDRKRSFPFRPWAGYGYQGTSSFWGVGSTLKSDWYEQMTAIHGTGDPDPLLRTGSTGTLLVDGHVENLPNLIKRAYNNTDVFRGDRPTVRSK